jgi:hypothetical protein
MPFVKDDPLIVQLRQKRKAKLKVKYPWRGDGSNQRKAQVVDGRGIANRETEIGISITVRAVG